MYYFIKGFKLRRVPILVFNMSGNTGFVREHTLYFVLHMLLHCSVPQVMYGGRAIDDFDRRVLKTYMDEYMGDFIFDTFQPFHFYHNTEVDYCIPEDGEY